MAGDDENNTLHNNTIGWGIMLVIFAVIIWIIWYYYDTEIRNLVRWIRFAEMKLIALFVGDNYTVMFNGKPVSFARGLADTPRWKAEALTYAHLSYFNALAMQPLKIPFALAFGALAFWALYRGPQTYYRQKLGLDGLIRRQATNFPVIAPFVKFNPSNQPPRPPGSPVPAELPLFAEALGPEEWLSYYEVKVPDGVVSEASARQKFILQLKGRWKGASQIAPHQQVLLAAFCLKAARKRAECDAMLGRLSLCWSFEKGMVFGKDPKLLKEARKVLKTKDIAAKTLAKCNQHAFITTALMRALAFAREEGGVLAPAQFVWLRAYDRTLWYPLNNMGRQSYHMEALGAMAHYKAENRTQRPIPVPKVDDAVQTITKYMKSASARPIPKLDYSGSQRKAIKKAV